MGCKKVAASLDFIFRTSVIKFANAELAKHVLGKRFVNVEDKTGENCQLANFISVASLSLQLVGITEYDRSCIFDIRPKLLTANFPFENNRVLLW